MRRITLRKGNEEYNINYLDNKIIAGSNYLKKFEMIKIFKEYFNNVSCEYNENRSITTQILINEKIVNPKKCLFLEISPGFDLNTDLKMGSKSLTLKYIEALFKDNIYFDSVNTIDLLFASLEDEINLLQGDIKVSLGEFNTKVLLKLLSVLLVKEEEQSNMYNLTYEELIILLIKMVSKITNQAFYEETFVILDIPVLTEKIYSYLESIEKANVFIFTNDFPNIFPLERILLYSSLMIDFADDEKIYTIFCEEHSLAYELKEIKQMLNNYMSNIKDKHTELISKILE